MSARHFLLTIQAPKDAKGKALWLRANGGHGNRYARAALIKLWRESAAWQARIDRTPQILHPVHITATIHLDTKPSHWDAANWGPTAKACVDGLVLHTKHGGADVLRGDCNCWVTGPDMRAGDYWADAALVLTFQEIESAA